MIVIEKEPAGFPSIENCCFCMRTTRWWNPTKDVAVCPTCAETNTQDDVPAKEIWCEAVAKTLRAPWTSI